MKRYNPKDIEPKWQKIWDETGVYTADLQSKKPKYFAMSMFNYPSGAGIHIGHAMNYTISDVKARFKRQQGYESYHPVGWDAFGLPAENYAIKAGVSPQESMANIIPGYHKQYKAMGWSNDWEKEIATHLPEYYKWTQWIFTQMHKHGLAYQDSRLQWWCAIDNTVLANEQVIDGKCWRHDGPDDPLVQKREVKQWFFKITDYADELLEATDDLDWTEGVKLSQKNWIGRSQGAEIDFRIDNKSNYILMHGFTASPKTDFHMWIKDELTKTSNDVFVPQLPNTEKPDAEEQARYVLEQGRFSDQTVLLGHSYGSVTALRVVEQLKSPIKRLVLAAGFAQPGFLDKERIFEKTTNWEFNFEKIKQNVGEIIILRDLNDSIVPSERADYLQEKLGGRIVDFAASGNHITGDKEPQVLENLTESVRVFTTRPDTIFGTSFLVLAPEHELVNQITSKDQKAAVDKYISEAQKKSELERQIDKNKKGVFTGAYAINPINGENIPVWIAGYVLTDYGTGAIMAVPAHDERDYDFAKKYDLPIKTVLTPSFVSRSHRVEDRSLSTDRQVSIVVAHDESTDKYCLIKWPISHHRSGLEWPGGGVDSNETLEQAALREFVEETGFNDAKVKKVLPAAVSFYYCDHETAEPKRAIKNIILLEVNSKLRNKEFSGETYEKDAYEVLWLKRDEIMSRFDQMDDHFQAITRFAFEGSIHMGEGVMINSGKYDNLPSEQARENIVADLVEAGLAKFITNYRMNDWSVGRQRYWGAPIPIIHCPKDGAVSVPDEDLPVVLPELTDFKPAGDGRSALARATDWLKVDCPKCGGPAERETDTLDTYICSSWYMLRYLDPHNQQQIFDSQTVNHWMPVDFYNGADHATAHLLYARFITRFFHKIGLVDNPEPFKQMLYNGKVTAADGSAFSKSKGNGVDPLEIINQGYGADALRTYLMFAAPLELGARWDPQGVPGAHRFLSRLWNLVQEYLESAETTIDDNQAGALNRATHQMIKKVSEDIEANRYNTAIAAGMQCLNEFYKLKTKQFGKSERWQKSLESLVACVAPFAPHIADELWQQLGHSNSIQRDSWPKYDEKYLVQDEAIVAIQVNGKLRGEIRVADGASQDEVVAAVKNHEKAADYLNGPIQKIIYVPGKIINFVI